MRVGTHAADVLANVDTAAMTACDAPPRIEAVDLKSHPLGEAIVSCQRGHAPRFNVALRGCAPPRA